MQTTIGVPYPEFPRWPHKDDVSRPDTKTLPLVNPADPTWKQIKDWILKKPLYIVTRDYFTYCPMTEQWIYLPVNFVYDYASIPRGLHFILRPNGLLGYGAGPHDFGVRFAGMVVSTGPEDPYHFEEMSKNHIDRIFGNLNNKSNKLAPVNNLATWTVSTFGGELDPIDIDTVDWSKPVYGKRY